MIRPVEPSGARRLLTASKAWVREQRCEAFARDRADRVIVEPQY